MKVALVYDHINKMGGAERVIQALHELYPEAPIYTLVHDNQRPIFPKSLKIIPSFLQKVPIARKHHEFFPIIPIFAFERFNFNQFDIVISITSAEAKGIITHPKTLHICYCLTPTRYLWSHYEDYFQNRILRYFSFPIISKLRIWDMISAQRPDVFLAISQTVALRVKKYYQRNAKVIYPPINLNKFTLDSKKNIKKYFLVVSRLVKYKHLEIAINACNYLRLPLKIVGSGMEKIKLQKLSGSTIEFIENLTDNDLIKYYQECQALIFPGEEDFGIVMVEAQACGRPVIAYKAGGACEIVNNGITGELFYPQTSAALIQVLKNFSINKYQELECRKQVEKFSLLKFKNIFSNYLFQVYKQYREKLN